MSEITNLETISETNDHLRKKQNHMKLSKYIMAGILASLWRGRSPPRLKVYITGSTAFRSAAVNGIDTVLAAGGGTIVRASDNAVFTSANAVVAIKASWSGSAGGVQTVAGAPAFNVRFLPDGATGTSNPDPRIPGNPAEPAVPDVAMTDVFQAATPFNGTFNGVTYATLTDNTVGVVTFVFAASKNFPLGTGSGTSSSYSMTPQLAQALYPLGLIPLSMITGSAADHDIGVIATGRDFDSGTRLTTMAETGVGVTTLLQQYKPTVVGTAVTALASIPARRSMVLIRRSPGTAAKPVEARCALI